MKRNPYERGLYIAGAVVGVIALMLAFSIAAIDVLSMDDFAAVIGLIVATTGLFVIAAVCFVGGVVVSAATRISERSSAPQERDPQVVPGD